MVARSCRLASSDSQCLEEVVAAGFVLSRWQRQGEALCGERKADGGALRVTQDGLAVTACLSWRGSYDEEFLQSWPPQGTAEFHILHFPSSQTLLLMKGVELIVLLDS
ncbi:F-box only protein 34 [Grus japonensis]|uniref:F-box only protein 34 n=1 Tax=Grus japonensis TaxID=30415 RepID=A0ABC9X144_GRUJA